MPTGVYKRTPEMKIGENPNSWKNGFQKGNKINLGKKNALGKHWKLSLSKEERNLKSEKLKRLWQNPDYRKKMIGVNKGRKWTDEVREKIIQANKGEKCYNWQGGISYEPYSVDWTKTLKKSIRERDRYTCQICGKEPAIYIHHIDYDKKNCSSENLITLCPNCHTKTNFNRNYWIDYFKKPAPLHMEVTK